MTMVSIVEKEHLADVAPFMAYLMGMTLEIGLYCFAATEITAAVSFPKFNSISR